MPVDTPPVTPTSELATPVHPFRSWGVFVVAIGVATIALIIGAIMVYGHMQRDIVAKGLFIGDIPVGGMTEDETRVFVQQMVEKLVTTPMELTLQHPTTTVTLMIDPIVVVSTDGVARDIVHFDEEQIVADIFSYGKSGSRFMRGWQLLNIRLTEPQVTLNGVEVDTSLLAQELQERTRPYRTNAIDANIVITETDPIEIRITESAEGITYPFDQAYTDITTAYQSLRVPTVVLSSIVEEPITVAEDLKSVRPVIETVLSQFPIQIVYTNTSTDLTTRWTLYPERAATLLEAQRNGDIHVGVQAEAFFSYLDDVIAPAVEVAPQNARFTMEAGRVSEFQGARPGIAIATSTMVNRMQSLVLALNSPSPDVTTTLVLATTVADPEIATEDVNDLGISELLGVGTSNFSGSPANRIANMRNAVNKLNGIIIAPGEEFSTIAYTKPYTLAGGYLPEKVIKGDAIVPEIGGGLCQIGTTLFRMAMNSGLEITERRNHSLAVSYYNDLENGLPGTDATLYDPAPDFRFKNDTSDYILIEADMDVQTGLLHFYLWGTDDGRVASYTPPQVLEWYAPGEARYIETTNLAPGVTECQNSYRGAYTSFTYTRQLPGKEPEDVAFTSRYRALPKICLIGVDPNDGETCTPQPDGTTVCDTTDTAETPATGTASSTPATI